MKKLLLLPLVGVLLSACSSDDPAPVVSVGQSDFANGNQYVTNEEMNSSWNDEVHQLPTVSYPATATHNPNAPQFDHQFSVPRDRVTGKPIYSQIKKGGYQGLQYRVQPGDSMFLIAYISGQPIEEIARLNHLIAPYDLSVGQVLTLKQGSVAPQYNSTPTNVHIPRNPQTNKPEYNKMTKGFYQGNTYTVRKGDTLYLVSYISGQSVEELATLNNLRPPYDLSAGQVLRLGNSSSSNYTQPSPTPVVNNTRPVSNSTPPAPTKYSQNLQWQWPTKGKVIDRFSTRDGGNKGIDIAGRQGQAIKAASSGQVVYAGNALQGYGNLIIIKHNNDYLSAYAHNHQILVKDKQWVKGGQDIATMGSTGTNSTKLHFEVRYKGQSTDPMRFLPK